MDFLKKLLKICVVLFSLFLVVCCDGSVMSEEDSSGASMTVYGTMKAKSLSGDSKRYSISKGEVRQSDFEKIREDFDVITGLSFEKVKVISGIFAQGEEDNLAEIQFDKSIERIEKDAFLYALGLKSVRFDGETVPEIAPTAFSLSPNQKIVFIVPVSSKALYEAPDALRPWIDSLVATISVSVTVTLDMNEEFYSGLGKVSVSENSYCFDVYSSVTDINTPTDITGWDFEGFYSTSDSDSDLGVLLFDRDGKAVDATGYTSNGNWIFENNIVAFAKWNEHRYTLILEKNNDGATGDTTSTELGYAQNYVIGQAGFEQLGRNITKWTTSGTSVRTFDANEPVSKLVAENGGSITLYGIWDIRHDVPYIVEYYMMNTSGTDYLKDDSMTETKNDGTDGEPCSVSAKDIDGFTYNDGKSTRSGIVSLSSPTVLKLYYDRNKYNVQWLDTEGNAVLTDTDYYGTVPTKHQGISFTKEPTAQYWYAFDGWEPEIGPITQDTTYKPKFESHIQLYTVNIFVNKPEYGSVSRTSVTNVEYGTVLKTSGTVLYVSGTDVTATPSPADANYCYSVENWTSGTVMVVTDTDVMVNFRQDSTNHTPVEGYFPCNIDLDFTCNGKYPRLGKEGYGVSTDNCLGLSVEYLSKAIDITAIGDPRMLGNVIDGFYTTTALDVKLVNAEGTFVENVPGYTDADGLFLRHGENIELYAKWIPLNYYLSFCSNGGTSGTMPDQKLTYDKTESISLNLFMKTGYTFKEWKGVTTSTTFTDGQEVLNLTTQSDEIIPLAAQWTPNNYTIEYLSNGGNGIMNSQPMVYDTESTLASNLFTKTGYSFKNWKDDLNGKVYAENSTVTNLTAEKDGVFSLTAQWTPNQYTITLIANGGDTDGSMEVTYDSSTASYNPAKTSNTNVKLDGYYLASDGTGKKIVSADGKLVVNIYPYTNPSGKWIYANDVSLYAKWIER